MDKHLSKSYPLRIDNDLKLKIEYIAKSEDRNLKQQYERILKSYVEEYERINGKLIVGENGIVTTSPHPVKVSGSPSRTG